MSFRKRKRVDLSSCCDAPGSGDGRDPRLEPRGGEAPPKVTNRKALQVCGQVARTLAGVLAGESADAVLRDLQVESVVPAPNSSRLLVTVSRAPSAEKSEPATVLAHLEAARGRLRSEVAGALHRRKTPDLIFQVVEP